MKSAAASDAAAITNVLVPFTSAKIGGSRISGPTLALGLKEKFGLRCIVTAPSGADVLSLATDMGLEPMASSEAPAARRWPHQDVLRTPRRVRELRRLGPGTIIHCNDLAALQSWVLAAKLTGTPIVYHNRGFARDFAPYRFLMRRADHVIAISEACNARLGFIPPRRRSVLTNPFLTPVEYVGTPARLAILEELGVGAESKLVGFVGNFWRRKRPEFFVDIAARLAAANPKLCFVFYGRDGDVSTKALAERIEAAGLTSRTLFAGFRLPPEANIASLDLLLMPAFDEPFGRTLVEALLMGIPYVAADDAGHSEIHARFGGGTVLAKEADADEYAQVCATILEDATSVALASDRRFEIAASLKPERHAEDVMAIYRRLN